MKATEINVQQISLEIPISKLKHVFQGLMSQMAGTLLSIKNRYWESVDLNHSS